MIVPFQCPSSTRPASVIASAVDVDPSSLLKLTSKMTNADRKQFSNAHIEKLANILIAQGDNFPKKPLRKTHLTQPYFTQLFGLTYGLASTKVTAVFVLYLQK
jgi:hypothetical protein